MVISEADVMCNNTLGGMLHVRFVLKEIKWYNTPQPLSIILWRLLQQILQHELE